MKVIQNLKIQAKALKLHYILYIVLVLGFFISFSNYSAHAENVNYQVNIDPALTITVTSGGSGSSGTAVSDITLDLNPMNHTFDSQSIDVTVATNNITGYKLAMDTINSSTDLTRNQDPNNTGTNDGISSVLSTLASTASGYSENDFRNCNIADCTNKWGFKVSSSDTDAAKVTTNYFPFQADNTLATNSKAPYKGAFLCLKKVI